jgi:molecular chaperone DnaJ
MYVELSVETPEKMTARQKELLEEFAAEGGGAESPQHASFLGKAKSFWDGLTD